MSRRLALLASAATALAATLLATGPAQAGLIVDKTVTAPSGDAPAAIDVVKARVTDGGSAYKATLTYRDLKPRKATRWVIAFADDQSQGRGTSQVHRNGNAVEVRVTPDGKVKTKAFDLYSNDSYEASTCPGTTATASWNLNKIRVTIPKDCWNLSTGEAFVSLLSRAFTPAEGWSTDLYDLGEGSKTDKYFFRWVWGSLR